MDEAPDNGLDAEKRDAVASRRRVLRWAAGVFAGSAALLGLAACGGEGGDEEEDDGGGGTEDQGEEGEESEEDEDD